MGISTKEAVQLGLLPGKVGKKTSKKPYTCNPVVVSTGIGEGVLVMVKPLSVNEAWKGQRFQTDRYKRYTRELLRVLPSIKINEPPYTLTLEFGFSNGASDIDNPVKCFVDIMQKKYGFNDKDITELNIKKKLVDEGKEYIRFSIW